MNKIADFIARRRRKVGKAPLTRKDVAKCTIATVLFLAFLLYIGFWWGIIFLPVLIDSYLTCYINWGWWKDSESPVTRTVMSWVDAIVYALVAVYFVNIYFFQNYTIPSSSLEKSLLVGDNLLVSKMAYGARVPQTPLHMPLCQHTLPFNLGKSYLEWIRWDYKRIHPKRVTLNDIVVFNYPAGDSILTVEPFQTRYYEECYGQGLNAYLQQHNGMFPPLDSLSTLQQRKVYEEIYQMGRQILMDNQQTVGHIDWRPVDRRENYVKRCVGVAGQTLQIKDRIIYLDGKANKEPDNVQYLYQVEWLKRLDMNDPLISEANLSYEDLYGTDNYGNPADPAYATCSNVLPLTAQAKKLLEQRKDLVGSVTLVASEEEPMRLYPANANYHWTRDNYGPVWIPAKGQSIPGGLNLENLPLYERLIKVYEGNDLQVTGDGRILINGKEAHNYTFQMDYYWMMGDNRHMSADSRYWGFVPEDHVVGKPVLVWFSANKDKPWFQGHVRWNRLFRLVDNIK